MQATTVRFDDATLVAMEAACKARGLKSTSEYVRLAVIAQLAWDDALALVSAGISADILSDRERLIAALLETRKRAG